MTLSTDLFDFLEANVPGVSFALTQAMPDEVAPFVEITLQDRDRTRTTEGSINGKQSTYEFECWHTSTVEAEILANSIIDVLEDYTGNLDGSSNVKSTLIINESQGSDGASELFHTTFTVIFTHT